MTVIHDVAIIGGGLAGAQAAKELRDAGYLDRISLVSDETVPPYLRPPLSKDYLTGEVNRDSVFVHPERWYVDHAVELILDNAARELDFGSRSILLADGRHLTYDALLLATGSTPRRLTIPGADLAGIHYLRRLDDSDRIRDAFTVDQRIVLIGAGWIGLEIASAARRAGRNVTIVEPADVPLQATLGPRLGQYFAELHRAHGVDLRLGASVEEVLDERGNVAGVRLAGGEEIPADVLIIGIGITPNTRLAEDGGLRINNGIAVDEHLRTEALNVYAAGDVANAYHPWLRRHLRVEHWANARHQPEVVAHNITGNADTYDRLPFFYSDQYDIGLEYVGYATSGDVDQVLIRGDITSDHFMSFWLSQSRVLAGMHVNTWGVLNDIEELIRSRRPIDPRRLVDEAIPLREA